MSSLTASPEAYREGAVLSATPAQLIVMLYDGARRFLRQGAAAMREGDVERAHNKLRRAELIIAYLEGTLDHEQGEIPANLNALYRFCLRHLNEARRTQDATKLEQVSDLLGELRDAWVELARG
jgi:flagellar secretion chaperone FliS